MVPTALQSMSNILLYYSYAESKYRLIETNAAATATDSMRHNDSYSQVEISHALPVIRENSYAVISTRLEAVAIYTLMLQTILHLVLFYGDSKVITRGGENLGMRLHYYTCLNTI